MLFPANRANLVQFDRFVFSFLILFLAILVIMAYANPFGGQATPALPSMTVGQNQFPLSFIPNAGQSEPSVQFTVQQAGATTLFTEDGLLFSWAETVGESTSIKTLRFNFLGAGKAAVQGDNLLPGTVNYFHGSDPANWHTGIPTYGTVTYENLYPGIDLVYSGNGRELVATFYLESGADLNQITWQYEGATVSLDATTDNLSLQTSGRLSDIQLSAPQARQVIADQSVPLSLNYSLGPGQSIGLAPVGELSTNPMIITLPDILPPALGGSHAEEFGEDIAVDHDGNIYVTGFTSSPDFPLSNPVQPTQAGVWDVFVTKFSADGSTLLYSTYLGGGDFDNGKAIAVDESGAAYLTGHTNSNDFPTANPMQPALKGGGDIFVSKLSADGSDLLYSTYLGGSAYETGSDILSKDNAVYLTGTTTSADFPTLNAVQPNYAGLYDAFVIKFSPVSNSLIFSSFLGGSNLDSASGLAVDGNNNVILVGQTGSIDFPTVNAIQPSRRGDWDAFLTALAANGNAYLFSTYLGGSGNEVAEAVALDSEGRVHIVGDTSSNDFPLANPLPIGYPGGTDAIVATLSPSGDALLFSSFWGGSNSEFGTDIAVDHDGNKYLVGHTRSTDFPTENPIQASMGGGNEIFVTKLNMYNHVVFSTYLGGSEDDVGRGIAADDSQNIYITGDTESLNFPTANAFQPGYAGGSGDVVVAKIDSLHYELGFSTYLGGGPYPENPTAVSLIEFDGRPDPFNPLLYLAAVLLLVLLIGLSYKWVQPWRD